LSVSVMYLTEGVYPLFVCARAHLLAAPGNSQNLITQAMLLCYSYVEWTMAGIKPRTFRLQGEHSTD